MTDILIKVDNVSKKFCRSLKRSLLYGLQDLGQEIWGRGRHHGSRAFLNYASDDNQLRTDEFWAVKDVSFELRRGECLGLIGRNGAGKTTLLKMLNGLIKPDSGSITMKGKVSALIALGAGFNPILTGRENVHVNASILGLSTAEIKSKIDEIIDFADIGNFMDTPVMNYSSGMQVRLGFAIAAALNPDILILDEVLAVGDASFRAKCYNRIGALQKDAAIIFVSHSMQQISQICSSILMLNNGKSHYMGQTSGGVLSYINENTVSTSPKDKVLIQEYPVRSADLSFSSEVVQFGGLVKTSLHLNLETAMPNCTIRITLYGEDGLVVAEWNSKRAEEPINLPAGISKTEILIGPIHLGPGRYPVALALNDSSGVYLPFWSLKNHSIFVSGHNVGAAEYQLPHARLKIIHSPL